MYAAKTFMGQVHAEGERGSIYSRYEHEVRYKLSRCGDSVQFGNRVDRKIGGSAMN